MNLNENVNTVIDKCEEINKNLNNVTCCFSGHRAQSLPWKFNEASPRCQIM